jgi:hypothetical protein
MFIQKPADQYRAMQSNITQSVYPILLKTMENLVEWHEELCPPNSHEMSQRRRSRHICCVWLWGHIWIKISLLGITKAPTKKNFPFQPMCNIVRGVNTEGAKQWIALLGSLIANPYSFIQYKSCNEQEWRKTKLVPKTSRHTEPNITEAHKLVWDMKFKGLMDWWTLYPHFVSVTEKR